MSSPPDYPSDYFFDPAHYWFCRRGTVVSSGLSLFFAESAGATPSVEPCAKPGDELAAGDVFARARAGGATVELRMPLAAKLREFNPKLAAEPSVLASDPHGEGWIASFDPGEAPPPPGLLARDVYVERFVSGGRANA